jgi:hypothetical protein
MNARRRTNALPSLESLEGRRLTASLAGQLTTTTVEIDSVAKPKPTPPPPKPTPPIDIQLSDVLVSSYS